MSAPWQQDRPRILSAGSTALVTCTHFLSWVSESCASVSCFPFSLLAAQRFKICGVEAWRDAGSRKSVLGVFTAVVTFGRNLQLERRMRHWLSFCHFKSLQVIFLWPHALFSAGQGEAIPSCDASMSTQYFKCMTATQGFCGWAEKPTMISLFCWETRSRVQMVSNWWVCTTNL